MKVWKWEQSDGTFLDVHVDKEKGCITVTDNKGKIRFTEKNLSEKELTIIENYFLAAVTVKEERHDPMFG